MSMSSLCRLVGLQEGSEEGTEEGTEEGPRDESSHYTSAESAEAEAYQSSKPTAGSNGLDAVLCVGESMSARCGAHDTYMSILMIRS